MQELLNHNNNNNNTTTEKGEEGWSKETSRDF